MTKEKLKQYNDLKIEIAKLEKRIDRLKKQSEMVSDVVQNGYKRHAVIRGYDCERAYKLDLTIQKLEDRKKMCEDLEFQIEDFINGIAKSELREIFSLRYIDNKNWIQIMHIMNELHDTEKYNDNSVRKKHDRYLKKFQEN